jgi:hypothetical protein
MTHAKTNSNRYCRSLASHHGVKIRVKICEDMCEDMGRSESAGQNRYEIEGEAK